MLTAPTLEDELGTNDSESSIIANWVDAEQLIAVQLPLLPSTKWPNLENRFQVHLVSRRSIDLPSSRDSSIRNNDLCPYKKN